MSGDLDRIAVISDIHGNLPALEAVLADIEVRGISTIYGLGDLAGKGPSGAEVIDICRTRCVATVQGNWDALIAGQPEHDLSAHPVNLWHRRQIGSERVAFLAGLPPTVELRLSGRLVRLFHASEKSIFHRVRQYDSRESHAAMFETTEFTGGHTAADIVGYGDIHVGYVKSFEHKCLFNAGSVGNPLDITEACYAVLEGRPNSADPAPWAIGITRVPYDIEAAIREAERSGMPDLDAYASELRTARYRGLTPSPPLP